ncbi:MAG: hypothetical protein LBR38_01445 [Synergistaceae bacterium]|nr:hypothetical protein [Synergistaceae bacterium]
MTVGEGLDVAERAATTLASWGFTTGEIVLVALIVLSSASIIAYTRFAIKTVEDRLTAKIDAVEERLTMRIDGVEHQMSAGIMKLTHVLRLKGVLKDSDVACVQSVVT